MMLLIDWCLFPSWESFKHHCKVNDFFPPSARESHWSLWTRSEEEPQRRSVSHQDRKSPGQDSQLRQGLFQTETRLAVRGERGWRMLTWGGCPAGRQLLRSRAEDGAAELPALRPGGAADEDEAVRALRESPARSPGPRTWSAARQAMPAGLITTFLTRSSISGLFFPSEWNADALGWLSLPGAAGEGPKQGRQTWGRFTLAAKSRWTMCFIVLNN